jgi:hypothetical protein
MNYVCDGIINSLMEWFEDNNNVTLLFFYVLQKKKTPHKCYSQLENSHMFFLVILLPEALTKTTYPNTYKLLFIKF